MESAAASANPTPQKPPQAAQNTPVHHCYPHGGSSPTSYLINHKQVARIMKLLEFQEFSHKSKVITTRRACSHRVFPDLVQPDIRHSSSRIKPPKGDITYLPVAGGKTCILVVVVDCYSPESFQRVLLLPSICALS